MRCAKCGKEIHEVLLNVFNFDGSDDFVEEDIGEIECCDAVYISTYRNGQDMICQKKNKEKQSYVRIVSSSRLNQMRLEFMTKLK